MRWAVVAGTLLIAALAVALCLSWAASRGLASASNGLACSVRANSCVGGEVEVFRISATSNAHAAAASDPTYTNLVCCSGVTGLGTSCSGTFDTVLRLSAPTDAPTNAHVQAAGSYPTEVCLSAGTAVVQCVFDAACVSGYACLATASGTDNAHVADCNGVDDYATKVCCYAGDPIPVGGIAELPQVSGSSGPNCVALVAGLVAAAVAALTAGAWYVRRWLGTRR